jgi:hypothetical protein
MKSCALMSLRIAAEGVGFVTTLSKRSSVLAALKEEWRDRLAARSALSSYTQLEKPTLDHYLASFCRRSETIDNIGSVYRSG